MSMQQVASGQVSAEIILNRNFQTQEHQALYGQRQEAHSGLTWAYYGSTSSGSITDIRWGGFAVSQGTLSLTDNAVNRIVVERATGAISTSTSDTNWNNTTDYARVYRVTTVSGVVTAIADHRRGPNGIDGGAGGSSGSSAAPLITESGSSRDIVPADAGSYFRFTGTGAKVANFDRGDGFTSEEEYHIANRAASGNLTLTVVGSPSITLNPPKGGTLVLEPGDTVTVKFITSMVADVFGSTEDL